MGGRGIGLPLGNNTIFISNSLDVAVCLKIILKEPRD